VNAEGAPDSLVDAYVSARRRLANLVVQGPADRRPAAHARLVAVGSRRERSGGARLGAREYGLQTRLADRTRWIRGGAARSSSRMGHGELRAVSEPRGDRYVAFVLRGAAPPSPVRLGSASRVDSLVELWQGEIVKGLASSGSARSMEQCRKLGAVVREAVWDPVAALLDGVERLLVVPDGSIAP